MSVSTENFLKGIYQLKNDYGEKANSSNLAKRLYISRAAITDMARKLAEKEFIIYEKYREISLTDKGRKLALSVIRRHRLWETFLARVLNLTPYEIHQEAEMLEHQTSENLISKIDEFLGYPQFDPHGDPIPDPTGRLPKLNLMLLIHAKPGRYTVSRIQNLSPEIALFFKTNHILIKQIITVKPPNPTGKGVIIEIENSTLHIDDEIAKCIYVNELT
ncbi:MAG: metal-dependent transcriptional regulator [Bacteroidales bacterium]